MDIDNKEMKNISTFLVHPSVTHHLPKRIRGMKECFPRSIIRFIVDGVSFGLLNNFTWRSHERKCLFGASLLRQSVSSDSSSQTKWIRIYMPPTA